MKPTRTLKTAHTLLDVLETLRELDGAGVTELAEEVGIAKSTAYDHLSTLVQMGYVVKDDDVYRLGLKFLDHGVYVHGKLENRASRTVADLAEHTGELAYYAVAEHGTAVVVDVAEGERGVRMDERAGTRLPIHATAAGKALLADAPERQVREVVERHGFDSLTDRTVGSIDELLSELDTVADVGVAFEDGERFSEQRAVAAPVRVGGEVCGAVCVSGPAGRLVDERFQERLPAVLRGAASDAALRFARPE